MAHQAQSNDLFLQVCRAPDEPSPLPFGYCGFLASSETAARRVDLRVIPLLHDLAQRALIRSCKSDGLTADTISLSSPLPVILLPICLSLG